MKEKVSVPDIGSATDVEVIEILVKQGDRVNKDDSLIVLESDKASMEIPSPVSGIIDTIEVKVGDQVDEGDAIATISVENPQGERANGSSGESKSKPKKDVEKTDDTETAVTATKPESVKESAGAATKPESVEESAGAETKPESVEESAGAATKPESVEESSGAETKPESVEESSGAETTPESVKESAATLTADPVDAASETESVHAGPSVRKKAREYGVDLAQIRGSGKFDRILKEDVVAHIKSRLSTAPGTQAANGIPPIPSVDFARFGDIEMQARSRTRLAGARNLHRSWLNIPHVTQFDKADITELENFRKTQNSRLTSRGIKLTPLAFLIRASVSALQTFPQFNSSLSTDGDQLIIKKYIHIGIAVETDEGLVVPVIRDADQKGLIQLAVEAAELALQAREKRLKLDALQGASFSISSLGGIGGTAFTPIVNAPEVAILGVSRTSVEPVYNGSNFEPRTLLPLSLSYDHRVIDGAEAARFTNHLSQVLSDTRMMLL